jgi:hypothetical protein
MSGKPSQTMLPHLARCTLVAPDVKAAAENEVNSKKSRRGPGDQHPPMLEYSANFPFPAIATGSSLMASATPLASPMPSPLLLAPILNPVERPMTRKRSRVSSFTDGSAASSSLVERIWNPPLQQEFGEDLCKLLIATRSSWNTAHNPQMQLFVEKWIPGAIVPDRRTLSGPILDREAGKVEEKLKLKLKERKATFQTDGWKNKAKQAIVATMVSVDFEVSSIISLSSVSAKQLGLTRT